MQRGSKKFRKNLREFRNTRESKRIRKKSGTELERIRPNSVGVGENLEGIQENPAESKRIRENSREYERIRHNSRETKELREPKDPKE